MANRSRVPLRVHFSVLMLVVACALTSGALVASNMGHIAKVHLDAIQTGVSKSGTNTLNLPYGIGPNIVTALDLMNDIGFSGTANVQRWIEATDTLVTYTGRKGSPNANFNLAAGECYYVVVSTSSDYMIVGNEKPSVTLALNAIQTGVSKSGVNFVSLPFNTTVTTAKGLMDDIGFASTANIQRFTKNNDGLEVYTGRKGNLGSNFPIRHDECYFIQMSSTVNYTPSHY